MGSDDNLEQRGLSCHCKGKARWRFQGTLYFFHCCFSCFGGILGLCRLGTQFCSCFSMVGCDHPGVSLALLYGGRALHFEWQAKRAARERVGKQRSREGQTPRACISYRMRQSLDLSRLPQKKSLLPGYGFTSLGCHLFEMLQWHVSRMDVQATKDFEQRF